MSIAVVIVIIAALCWYFKISLFVPLIVMAGLWLAQQGLKEKADLSALEAARQSRPYQQGQWVAVFGKAVTLDSNAELLYDNMLAYRYQYFDVDLSNARKRQDGRSLHLIIRYDGFYLTPSGISTDGDIVKMGGFPDMIHTEQQPLSDSVVEHVEDIAQPNSKAIPPFVTRAYLLGQTQDQIDVAIQYRFKELSPKWEVKSWTLKPGDDICVFGKWNNGELVPSPNRPRGLPLYFGTADDVLKELTGLGNAMLMGSGVFFVAAAGLVIWSLY